jgi:hypothetical protein
MVHREASTGPKLEPYVRAERLLQQCGDTRQRSGGKDFATKSYPLP